MLKMDMSDMSKELRNREIKVRLTEIEKEKFEDLAREHRISVADLVRFMVLGPNNVKKLPSRDLAARTLRQVRGVGNNINQIAKKVNESALRNSHKLNPEIMIKLQSSLREYKVEHEQMIDILKEAYKK